MTVRSSDLAPEGQREGRGPLQHLLRDPRSWLGKRSPAPHPSLFKHLRAPGKKPPGADEEVSRGGAAALCESYFFIIVSNYLAGNLQPDNEIIVNFHNTYH